MAKKVYEEENIRAIADKIREKTGSDATYKTSQMANGVEEVYEAGQESGNAGYEQGFEDGKNSMPEWDRWLNSASLVSLNMFKTPEAEINFERRTNDSFINFLNVTTLENANTTVEHLTISCPILVKSIQQMFYAGNRDGRDYKLKRLTFNIDIQNATNVSYAFSGLRALEILDGLPLNFSSATNLATTFNSLYELIEFRVVPNTIKVNLNLQHSSKLSAETIKSIIDGLKDFRNIVTKTYENVSYSWDAAGSDEWKNQVITIDWENGGDTWLEVQGDGYGLGFMAEGSDWPVVLNVHLEVTKAEAEEMLEAKTFMLDDNNTLTLTYEQPPTETRTLTIGETNLAKLSDEEKAIATDKGWILA